MSSTAEMIDLFLRLATIDSTSLDERRIADEVTRLFRSAGVRVVEDGSASILGGTAGNLFCYPPHFRPDRPSIVLTSHLDTVKSTAKLKPVVDATSIRSDGTTILGGDNRLGLSVLVRLLTEVAKHRGAYRNFFVLCTVGEETGLFGAGTADLASHQTDCAYVFDCSKRPGTYIRESVGLHTFTAQFIGKTAHSGVAPEEGVSAIQLASRAIASLQLGRIDAETTANVGKIVGGEAINAIPEKVTIEGEVRSYTSSRIAGELGRIERSLRSSVDPAGRLAFTTKSDFEPYILSPGAPMIIRLERAMRAVGLEPHPIRYTGGSDANKYNAKGIPAVNLGIGAQKPHSNEEFVLIEDLVKTSELAWELIRDDA
ncbi:MAG: M20/M25/M40 family metallo-hydrolase [Bacteroidetes bacterium]|nr:M20/M25/M40 family metallo-hydrolase [Bacteroidota bacterium]